MGPPLSKGPMEIFIESKLIGIWLSMLDIEYAPLLYDLIWIMNIVNCAQHDLAIDNYCDLFSLSLLMI
jgi:hypothetical protein